VPLAPSLELLLTGVPGVASGRNGHKTGAVVSESSKLLLLQRPPSGPLSCK